MRTLTIELRWPPCVRMIEGKALTLHGVELDPPPLLVAACASKARAESARRGWQTRKAKPIATGVAAAVAQEWMICPAGERYCKGCYNAIPHKRDHLCIGAPGTCQDCIPCEAPKTEGGGE